eukprot:Mrub_02968.p1 GENE.Mrub_02968~~Mrub_02968.p1  ORF type:complete len:287 (+),score=35.08 Mrub_02968:2-862(+)
MSSKTDHRVPKKITNELIDNYLNRSRNIQYNKTETSFYHQQVFESRDKQKNTLTNRINSTKNLNTRIHNYVYKENNKENIQGKSIKPTLSNRNNNSSFSLYNPEVCTKLTEHTKKKSSHSSFILDSGTVNGLIRHEDNIDDKYSKLSISKIERKQDLQRYDKHLKSKLSSYILKFEEDDSRSTVGSHSEFKDNLTVLGDNNNNEFVGRIKRSYKNDSHIEFTGWTPVNQSNKLNAKKLIVKDKNNNSFVDSVSFNGYGNLTRKRSSSKKLISNKNSSSIGNLLMYE